MSGDNWSAGITVEGHGPDERLAASWNRASPPYFETIGTPVLRGPTFPPADGPTPPPVAVVTASFAARYFGDRDPIGKHLGFGPDPANQVNEIVGVVGEAKYHSG